MFRHPHDEEVGSRDLVGVLPGRTPARSAYRVGALPAGHCGTLHVVTRRQPWPSSKEVATEKRSLPVWVSPVGGPWALDRLAMPAEQRLRLRGAIAGPAWAGYQ